jgi:rubrerythrin
MRKSISDLEEREILALAIALEAEDSRIYRDFVEKLKANHPATASILQSMYEEEVAHRAAVNGTLSAAVWRSFSLLATAGRAGRAGVCHAEADVAKPKLAIQARASARPNSASSVARSTKLRAEAT